MEAVSCCSLRYLERRPEPDGLIVPEAELRTQPKNSLCSRSCWCAAGVVDDGIAEEARWAFVSLSGWEACKSSLSEPVLPLLPLCPRCPQALQQRGFPCSQAVCTLSPYNQICVILCTFPPFYFSSCSYVFAGEMQSVKSVPFL